MLPQECLMTCEQKELIGLTILRARRTAFIARFIVLREAKRSRAHRAIEKMTWQDYASAEDIAEHIRQLFIHNGDNMEPVERDIRRALAHANRSLNHFINEYAQRSTLNFYEALLDYEKSNTLLFGDDEEQPKVGGWHLPHNKKNKRNKKIEISH